jgi:alginate O-acetyltransferase complex protein AlgI
MLFPTLSFFLFFVAVFPAVIVLKPHVRVYKIFLLALSLVFYSFWNINFTYVLVAGIVVNYGFNYLIDRQAGKPNKLWAKLFLTVALILNLALLAICKYHSFFVDSFLQLLNNLNLSLETDIIRITAPIGISFYTFRQIAHLVDIYQQKIPLPSALDFANFVAFFPQIASGPICRPQPFYEDLNNPHKYRYQISAVGINLISGLFKKYVISSYLFTITQRPFSVPNSFNSLELFVAMLAYACLIFVDFSGYSDLANAVTMLMGFRPVPNFQQPYGASSLSEFWGRWHISLSQWLRDYLYIPMGGSRVAVWRKYFNLFMTMFLGGIWHGVGLNFILWGALHGVGLWFSHFWSWLYEDVQGFSKTLVKALGIVATFAFVCLTWIPFNCSSLETTADYFMQMFSFTSMNALGELGGGGVISGESLGVIGLVLAWHLVPPETYGKISTGIANVLDRNLFLAMTSIGGAIYLCLRLGPETVPPFIYFNF